MCVGVCGGGSQGITVGRIYPWQTTKDASEVCQSALISLQWGQRGNRVLERVSQFYRLSCFLSASKSSGCLWVAVCEIHNKSSSWEILSQSKQASAARCSKYEPVIWSLRFSPTKQAHLLFKLQGLWQFPIKEQKKNSCTKHFYGFRPRSLYISNMYSIKHKKMASDTARLRVSCVKTQVEGFDWEGFMTVNTNTVVQKLSQCSIFFRDIH